MSYLMCSYDDALRFILQHGIKKPDGPEKKVELRQGRFRPAGFAYPDRRSATDVHHNAYTKYVLAGADASQLVSLCRRHHEEAEFKDGQKVPLHEARSRLSQMGVTVQNPRRDKRKKKRRKP